MVNDKDIKRFVTKTSLSESGCINWTAGCDLDGYGLFKLNGKTRRASIVAMLIEHNDIPNGKWVLHKCDNRKCVNPNHLYFGTPSQNSIDRERRGRGRCLIGEQNGFNKLSNDDIVFIKKSIGRFTGRDIAKFIGVTPSTISYIKSGKVWKHITL